MNSNAVSDRERISTYKELDRYVQAFARGSLRFIIVAGPPGVGKTEVFQRVLGERAVWITGSASPFGMYCTAFQNADQPIVLDDIDGLCKNADAVRLLKALCDTSDRRTISWTKAPAYLQRGDIPSSFTTTSPVAIITNEWKSDNADVQALEDRAHMLEFYPSAIEVHRKAAEWFRDQEVYDFIRRNLRWIPKLSFRLYLKAAQRKRSNLPWKEFVLNGCDANMRIVAELKANKSLNSDDRVQQFKERTGKSRATYFNYAKKFRSAGSVDNVPHIQLRQPAPQTTPLGSVAHENADEASSVPYAGIG